MPKYFTGRSLGTVTELPGVSTFQELAAQLSTPVVLPITRAQYEALKTDKERHEAKRVKYITPAVFEASPSTRSTEHALYCDILALDVDDSNEARRILKLDLKEALGEYSFIVWHTASSTPQKPRLRILVAADRIPLRRYEAAVRTISETLGLSDVTKESTVPVQPMYWPVMFADETATPVLLVHEADLFTAMDILEGGTDGADQESAVGDLDYLEAPMEGVTLEDAKGALEALDPSMNMAPWIEVACGLKHQFNSDDAFQLWNEWSKRSAKYPGEDEMKSRWRSLKAAPTDRKPVTIRTLFKMAKLQGWTNPTLGKKTFEIAYTWIKSPSRSMEELLDQGAKKIAACQGSVSVLERATLIQALAQSMKAKSGEVTVPLPDLRREVKKLEIEAVRTTGLPLWAKGLCYVSALNVFYRPSVDRKFAPEVLDLMHASPAIGEEKPMRPRDFLMQIADIPRVENLRYDPSKPDKRYYEEEGRPYCNTYRPAAVRSNPDRAEEAGAVFTEHIENLIAEPEHRRTVIDFLAYHVQHPGKKIRWAVLLQGAQGCGKSAVAVAMTAVLGRRNVRKVNADSVMNGTHNDWAYGAQLVVMEEVRIMGANRFAVMDKLKPCISDDEISLHRKFEHHQTVPNITNYLMFTNHHDSLAIHDNDRRYFVLSSPLQTERDVRALGGPAYFDRYFAMVRENAGGLKAWLEQWKISEDFKPESRAPVTEYMRELIDASATPLMNAVRNILEDMPHPLIRGDLVSLQAIRSHLEGPALTGYSDQALAGILRELNWKRAGRFQIDGFKHQFWTMRKMKNVREIAEKRLEYL